jgi:hypothetical protein
MCNPRPVAENRVYGGVMRAIFWGRGRGPHNESLARLKTMSIKKFLISA